MKRILALLAAVCCLAFTYVPAENENLIYNGAFDMEEGGRYPEGWYTSGWNSANSFYEVTEEDGWRCLYIDSYENNDARWVQDVIVTPGESYRVSCYVKAEDCSDDGRGANISILDTSVYSESVYDTEGEWVLLELYGRAAKKQDMITVALRIGGYSGDCTGKAWFRDVRVETSEIPDGFAAESFATFEPYVPSAQNETLSSLPQRQTPKWALVSFVTVLAFVFLSVRLGRRNPKDAAPKPAWEYLSLGCVTALALALRIYYAVKVRGYSIDITDFMAWGESFRTHGLRFYADVSFCDYPPVYMMLMGLVSSIRQWTGVMYNSAAHVLMVKSIPILCDLAAALIVYRLARKKWDASKALMLCAFVAVNPAYIVNSAAWGQVDSVLALMLMLCVVWAMDGRWTLSLAAFALAVLTKPQALIFGPLGLILMASDFVKNKSSRRGALIGIGVSLGLIYLVSLPFASFVYAAGGGNSLPAALIYPFKWIWGQWFSAAGGYARLSVNACNLYTLIGKNWGELGSDPLSIFSWTMLAVSYLLACIPVIFSKKRGRLPLAGALLMAFLFAFAPMMHERYLFPALILALLAYIRLGDRRILYCFILASAAQFLNAAMVLEWGQYTGFEDYGHLQASEQAINAVVSAVNVVAALFLCWTAYDVLLRGRVRHVRPYDAPGTVLQCRDCRLHLKRLDVLLMAGVTVVYSAFAFWNLGTRTSPVTEWTSGYFEQVTFDLGETRTYRFTYFGGISNTGFTVALSNDGENWTEENYAAYSAGYMYRWLWYVPQRMGDDGAFSNAGKNSQPAADTGEGGASVTYADNQNKYPLQTSRYLRITSNGAGLKLGEVAFIDTENECLFPVASVSSAAENATVSALTDEQHAVSLVPSYYNGMYFDEIYHARTAYEMLQGYRAEEMLEWSHPQLGKLIIMIGIKLFGMTPFGWRCMGTLFGALMLPVMYLLIRQLTGKTTLSACGMLLLALDSMHFTQTRIATVDTYAVFFIMLMYLFMIRYYQMNLHTDGMRTLIPLSLSGLCMALAWASKWTGLYASVGLAVIFFMSLFRRLREYMRLKDSTLPEDIAMRRQFRARVEITLGVCLVMFVAVPVLVYYFHYWPWFRTSGGLSVQKVWDLQLRMYNYHSTLVDNHYFKTPWYEWPLIVKPMWYYSADMEYVGRGAVSSISCMGNPAVWWTGLAALIAALWLLALEKNTDHAILLTVIGFASQFLPWVLVPRSTFIYHYFASVPFIIVAIALIWDRFVRFRPRAAKAGMFALLAAALVLFAAFYPLESGYQTTLSYAKYLRWFNWYNYDPQ